MTVKIDADTSSGLQLESDTSGVIDIQSGGTTKMTVGTTIDIQGNELVLDADADTSIHADTDDQIDFKVGGTDKAQIDSSGNLKFDSGLGSVQTAYGVRAWVNFNGTGTLAIQSSGGVSSVTDNSAGNYTVNFSTAMPDANYSTQLMCTGVASNNNTCILLTNGGTYSTSAVQFHVTRLNSSTTREDSARVCVHCVR